MTTRQFFDERPESERAREYREAVNESEEAHGQAREIRRAVDHAERGEQEQIAQRHGMTTDDLDAAVREQREQRRNEQAEAAQLAEEEAHRAEHVDEPADAPEPSIADLLMGEGGEREPAHADPDVGGYHQDDRAAADLQRESVDREWYGQGDLPEPEKPAYWQPPRRVVTGVEIAPTLTRRRNPPFWGR